MPGHTADRARGGLGRAVAAALVAGLGAAAVPHPVRAAVPVLVIEGRGHGHGVGMAQDGAYWMARGGATTDQILRHFYPSTTTGRAGGPVRVPVLEAQGPASLAFPDGGEVRGQGAGFPVRVPPGGEVRVVVDGGRVRVEGGRPEGSPPAATGAASGPQATGQPAGVRAAAAQDLLPPLFPPSSDPLLPPLLGPPGTEPPATTAPPTAPPPAPDAPPPASSTPVRAVPAGDGTVSVPARQRRYRGAVEATAGGAGLRLVNEVDVEHYLKGMGEVRDPGWPAAALRSQAVAARTYALRAMAAAGEVCETQRCQVYLGAQAEYGAMNRAVDATRGQVLLYGRSLASAVYSANGGGHSASQEEGFGVVGRDVPYLRPAPYRTSDPSPWTVRVALSDLRRRFGYPGRVEGARASRTGPSGRVLEVTLDGDRGPRAVEGLAFDAGLSLRSTLFTLRVEEGEAPAPPPDSGGGATQLPPGGGPEASGAPGVEAAAGPAPPEGPPPVPVVVAGPAGGGRRPREGVAVAAAWFLLAVSGATVMRVRRPPARPDGGRGGPVSEPPPPA